MAKGTIQKGFRGVSVRVAARHARAAKAQLTLAQVGKPVHIETIYGESIDATYLGPDGEPGTDCGHLYAHTTGGHSFAHAENGHRFIRYPGELVKVHFSPAAAS